MQAGVGSDVMRMMRMQRYFTVWAGLARSHDKCDRGAVHQEPGSADQFLKGQGAAHLGCAVTGVHSAPGWHVPEGT